MTNYFLLTFPLLFLLATGAIAQSNTEENNSEARGPETKIGGRGIPDGQVIEPEDPFTVRMRNRKTPLPPYEKLDPKRASDPKYVAEMWWEHLGYRTKESAIESLQIQKRDFEAAGLKWTPPQPGNPDSVEEYFTIPPSEQLSGCTYVKGYSYPDICVDGKNNKIFDSSTDSQAVLDMIVIMQGRLGKYNKMPKIKPKSTSSKTIYEND